MTNRASKPWLEEKPAISERTWYRRQKEARDAEASDSRSTIRDPMKNYEPAPNIRVKISRKTLHIVGEEAWLEIKANLEAKREAKAKGR